MAVKINEKITLSMKWKIFKEFLLRENAFTNYLSEYGIGWHEYKPPLTEYLRKVDLRSNGLVSSWLFNSMCWCDTKEGFDFWYQLSVKLEHYCAQFEPRTGLNLEKYKTTRLYGKK